MGMFCLPNDDSIKEELSAAIANIEMYLRGNDSVDNYLLEAFAIGCIKRALEKLAEK